TPPTPADAARSTSRINSSGDACATPGIDSTGLRRFLPSRTNNGSTSCDGASIVSRTRFLKALVLRNRRPLYSGNEGIYRTLFRLRRDDSLGRTKLGKQASGAA